MARGGASGALVEARGGLLVSRHAHAYLWFGIFIEQDEFEDVYKNLAQHQAPTEEEEESTTFEMDPEEVSKDDVVDLLNHVIEHQGFKGQIKLWAFDNDEDGIAVAVPELFFENSHRYLGRDVSAMPATDHPIFKLLRLMYDEVDDECLQWCICADYF